ncbi:hypothetical protein R1flu_025979 [Riccia fluitans]|uniref:Uncharacterized protein n=1 Tax=Riccia fluitans TaxID=41844 RepID=A0ABD1XHN7_9MARC
MEGRSRGYYKVLLLGVIVVLLVSLQAASARNVILVLDDEALKEKDSDESQGEEVPSYERENNGLGGLFSGQESQDSNQEWDEFGDNDDLKDEDLDPGSWRQVLEREQGKGASDIEDIMELERVKGGPDRDEILYEKGVRNMVDGLAEGDPVLLAEAISELRKAADGGHPHAQSTLGFLHGSGYGIEKSDAKAHLYHHFAAEGGNFQSKMALAYSYHRQQLNDKAVKLYGELASTAMASFRSSKEAPLLEPVRLNDGSEESREFEKFRGEDDDDFQFLLYKAHKGFALAMYRLGFIYYLGLRGVPRDHTKALTWFLRAVEKGDSESMELLGEIYARGFGVERNYTRAMEWFVEATKRKQHSANNGIGWLYAKGLGMEKKNFTKAKEYFKKAADANDPDGIYNLGILYLRGLGLQKDVDEARRHFLLAANVSKLRHPKALYQLAKMYQKGIGAKMDPAFAVELYKIVAERGPWGSLLKWALECYVNRDIGKALLFYSRAAELGYEVAQSNAAWILDKYYNEDVCIGAHGICTDAERHQRAHALWRYASEQGNQHAALLIGDAYYYGRGTEKDLERAAEAYNRARLQQNAQAMFNLGYMHEHGVGLPMDLHLAKRYYDQALETDHDAALPVTLALMGLWLRQHYAGSFVVKLIDAVSESGPSLFSSYVNSVSIDEGNATLITLFVCLVTVLYLRQRHRRVVAAPVEPQPIVEPPVAQ